MIIVRFALALACTGCASFATVRSAQVNQGFSFTGQASVASPPGDEAAWFFQYDCGSNCNATLPGGDLGFAVGRIPASGNPYAVGVGFNGFFPYVEGYLQLGRSRTNPYGVGARLGIPLLGNWSQHQLYARVNRSVGSGVLLWNPGLLLHHGRSPNGENPGSLLGVVNGFGWQHGEGPVVLTPSVAVVFARAQRNSYGQRFSESSVFGTAGLSVTLRRRDWLK